MLTVVTVLAVRALVFAVVIGAVAVLALLLRRWLRRAGRWNRVQELVGPALSAQAPGSSPGGLRSLVVRVLHRWLDDGAHR